MELSAEIEGIIRDAASTVFAAALGGIEQRATFSDIVKNTKTGTLLSAFFIALLSYGERICLLTFCLSGNIIKIIVLGANYESRYTKNHSP